MLSFSPVFSSCRCNATVPGQNLLSHANDKHEQQLEEKLTGPSFLNLKVYKVLKWNLKTFKYF